MKDANRAPAFACLYHGLCDIARERGYALAIHGSVITDLDLVAIPWTEEAVSANELFSAIETHIGRCGDEGLMKRELEKDNPELKPHGRLAYNLYMTAGAKVDLSVMPRKSDFQYLVL